MSAYVTAYNAGDIDEVMSFFSADSVITGHPYPVQAKGLDGIRELHIADREAAAAEDPYEISDLEFVGDTATWNQTWLSSTGQEFCHEGQTAVIRDGLILSWDWSSGSNCA
jgi:ketosteroid isomerase-like protein